MKKTLIILSVLLLAVSCAHSEKSTGFVGIANPFSDLNSLSDAESLAGFSMTLPVLPEEYDEVHYRVMTASTDRMLEVIFRSSEGGEIRIRKAPGNSDISGDYNTYGDISTTDDGKTLKGNEGVFSNAVWVSDGFSYSVSFSVPVVQEYLLSVTEEVR